MVVATTVAVDLRAALGAISSCRPALLETESSDLLELSVCKSDPALAVPSARAWTPRRSADGSHVTAESRVSSVWWTWAAHTRDIAPEAAPFRVPEYHVVVPTPGVVRPLFVASTRLRSRAESARREG